jgi:hypothetical protein
MRLSVRRRFRIALAVIACLLFQQMALATYSCSLDRTPFNAVAMPANCAAMDMQHATDNPALCAKHCAPDLSTSANHNAVSVPPLMLPPVVFHPMLVTTVTHVAVQSAIPIERSDSPPRTRYCSLQI